MGAGRWVQAQEMVFEIRHSGAEHSEPMRYRHLGQYLEGREAWLEGGLRVPEV